MATELPEEILADLTQLCGMEPSQKLKSVVASYLRGKHSIQGIDPRPNWDVIAMAAAMLRDVAADHTPKVVNPFAKCAYGTPLEVLRVDSKEVYCVGFWMAAGEGINGALVQVAMHDSEEEAGWFPHDQIRLRGAQPPAQPPESGPIKIVFDPPEPKEESEPALVTGTPEADLDDDEAVETPSTGETEADSTAWSDIEHGAAVWMEDGCEGEFVGLDAMTGGLKVRVKGKHVGHQFSSYLPDQVCLAEEIPVEHDPVDVGYADAPDAKLNPYSLAGAK